MSADIEKVVSEVRNALLEELLSEIPTILDEEHEVCAGMLYDGAKRRGLPIGERSIMNMLEAKVESGEMIKRYAQYRGRRVVAYRKVDIGS